MQDVIFENFEVAEAILMKPRKYQLPDVSDLLFVRFVKFGLLQNIM